MSDNPDEMHSGPSEAKQTLLRALESIDEAEEDVGSEVRHVAVVYSVYRRDEDDNIREAGGWNHSTDPAWLIATLLRRGADAIEGSTEPTEEGDE